MSNTPKRKHPQARQFTARVFQFLTGVAKDRELPPSAEAIAIVLSQFFNRKHGGSAWPSLETIAEAIGINKSTIWRTLKQMERRGHLRIDWGQQGRGHSSQYWMAAGQAEKLHPRNFKRQGKVATKVASTSLKVAPTQLNHLETSMRCLRSAVDESETALSRDALDPRTADAARIKIEGRDDASKKETTDQFADLRAIWVRPWPDNGAADQLAYTRACRIADPADIIEAAKIWVADAPRFLPPLARWLDDHGWLKVPPVRKQSTYRRGKADLATMMLQAGGVLQ